MTLSGRFVAASGSVTGREHRRAERDGQDGHALVVTDQVVAAIVTDGCSSGLRCEIGARIGASWLAALITQAFGGGGPSGVVDGEAAARAAANDVASGLLVRLELLARSLDPGGAIDARRVDETLLFGFLAAVVTPSTTIVFGIGDGIVVVDDDVTSIDPGPDNAPPYAAYGLLDNHQAAPTAPRVHFLGATTGIEVVAVATDGLAPIATTLATLASDRRYAVNASLLRKRLVVLSDGGTFSDDATVAVVSLRER